MAKKKLPATDGLGPREVKQIRTALRLVWQRSHARKLCVARCVGAGGFSYCEKCKKRSPKVFIDHIVNCGEIDEGFLKRLFTPSKNLQGMCKACHDEKTRAERKRDKALKDRNKTYF